MRCVIFALFLSFFLLLVRKIKIILSSSEQKERGDKTRNVVVLLSTVVGRVVTVVVTRGVGVEREREREIER